MNSGGHRGFTVVTIVTLIFAPLFTHHEWVWRLVGETKVTHVEQCAPKQPCPPTRTIVNIVREPIPGGGSPGGGDQGGGDQDGGNQGSGKGGGDHGGGDHGGPDHGGKGKH